MEWSTNAFNNIVGIQNYYTEWMKQNIVMILYACIWNPRDFQQTYSDKKKKTDWCFSGTGDLRRDRLQTAQAF